MTKQNTLMTVDKEPGESVFIQEIRNAYYNSEVEIRRCVAIAEMTNQRYEGSGKIDLETKSYNQIRVHLMDK